MHLYDKTEKLHHEISGHWSNLHKTLLVRKSARFLVLKNT